MDKLLKFEDVAEEFGLSPRTIKRWVAAGQLSAVRLSTRTVRFRAEDVAALIEAKRTERVEAAQ